MPLKSILNILLCISILQILPDPAQSSSDIFCYLDPDCDPYSPLWAGDCKQGANQSPIDLPFNRTKGSSNFTSKPRDLIFNSKYSSFPEFHIQDNGHTVQVSLSPNLTSSAQLSGDGFEEEYILAQIHFHWGENDTIGSEHTLNGQHYPMELHMVHYNSKYSSFQAAVSGNDPKSLAVLARFLTPGLESDVNEPFDAIASACPLDFQASPVRIPKPLDLSKFLPKSGETFYRYMGSLTTPNCTEDVIWTVLTEPLRVKPSEIEKFRKVRDHESHPLGENFRPTQPLNGRLIEFFHKKELDYSSDSSTLLLGNAAVVFYITLLVTMR